MKTYAIILLVVLQAALGTACKTTTGSQSGVKDVGDNASGGRNDTSDFLNAYREYLSFYSQTSYAQAAVNRPDVKTILFGKLDGPYDLQTDKGSSIDALMAQTDFTPKAANSNNIGCTPTFIQADSQASFRGSIVILHGFSACPMQFYEYAVMLAKEGYNVFIPLLPGEGRAPIPLGSSPMGSPPTTTPPNPNLGAWYGAYMPNYDEEERYMQFASYINDMMVNLPGDKIVIGLSGGAALAHYMSIERAPFYKRALLLTSYYHQRAATPADPVFDSSNPPTSPQFLAAMNAARPFGTYCYANTYAGRRGICDMLIGQALSLNRFANKFVDTLQQQAQSGAGSNWPQTQFITVENDSGSDTVLTRKVFQLQRQANPATTSLCFFGKGIPHAFISQYDNHGASMFWLTSFYRQSRDFIENGTVYPVSGTANDQPADGNTYSYCAVPH